MMEDIDGVQDFVDRIAPERPWPEADLIALKEILYRAAVDPPSGNLLISMKAQEILGQEPLKGA